MKKGIITTVTGMMIGAITSAIAVGHYEECKVEKKQKLADKHLLILQDLNQWLIIKQQKKSIKPFFDEHKYQKIAIYGMSYLGERLYDDLKPLGIEVVYAVDRNAINLYAEVPIYEPSDNLPEVDAIIVTSTFFFDEIQRELALKVDFPIISLEDILYWI